MCMQGERESKGLVDDTKMVLLDGSNGELGQVSKSWHISGLLTYNLRCVYTSANDL